MPFSIKAELDAVMHGSFTLHTLTQPHVRQEINSAVLEHSGANRRFDLCSAPAFEHSRINPLPGQEQREQ